MNQGDFSYRNSLMSFVKDLGPTAQMVARRKLLGDQGSIMRIMQFEKCQNHSAKQRKESGCSQANARRTAHTGRNIIDLTEDGEEAHGKGKEKIDVALRSSNKEMTTTTAKMEAGNHKSHKIGRGLRSEGGKSDDNVRPVILALESSHSKGGATEYRPRYKKSSSTGTTVPWKRDLQKEDEEEVEDAKKSPPGATAVPLTTSQFMFDLPFLKARLDQMHALDRN